LKYPSRGGTLRNGKSRRTLLIIDDERLLCDSVSGHLADKGIETLVAHTGAEGMKICSERKVDVVLLDQNLPDIEGYSICPSILHYNDQCKIILITAYPSLEDAVKAIKAGAHDYICKPFELQELDLAVEQTFRTMELEKVEQIQGYKTLKESEEAVLVGLGESRGLIDLAASSEAPALVTGETGTGKSLVARWIHYNSSLRKSAFISVNCAAFPESLIEAELFGYEKGAFTGATSASKGIFEMAEGGTLLLDEIGEMPLHLQSKLLGVLEDKKIKRLGGDSVRPVDVRIIATTNRDLESSIKSGEIREDLYYRLSVIRIHIPPLRERNNEIPGLCDCLLRKMDGGSGVALPDPEMERLMEYGWPGNVRELRNVLERAVLLRSGPELKPSVLLNSKPDARGVPLTDSPRTGGIETLKEIERKHVEYTLGEFSGNYSRTARALGISLTTLKRKLRKYGLMRCKLKGVFTLNYPK
jgi:DNA-binding NtrC family response regulator